MIGILVNYRKNELCDINTLRKSIFSNIGKFNDNETDKWLKMNMSAIDREKKILICR